MGLAKTKTEFNLDIVNEYIRSGQPWPADRRAIAQWAVDTRKWSPPPRSIVEQCAEELAEAMRHETTRDPQGRIVRSKHCALIVEQDAAGRKKQRHLWFDYESATPELMRKSLQQRRKNVFGDVKQLKQDLDSYNDNNRDNAYIQMSFNFDVDLAESEQDTQYNPDA